MGSSWLLVQRVEPGGATTGRTIVVRVRELPSPQLFPTRDLDPANPLGLKSPSTEIPLFLIDLNVLFDLGPRRQRNDEGHWPLQGRAIEFLPVGHQRRAARGAEEPLLR